MTPVSVEENENENENERVDKAAVVYMSKNNGRGKKILIFNNYFKIFILTKMMTISIVINFFYYYMV